MSNTAMSEHKRIYLDYAAATPLSPRAAAAMRAVQRLFGNPSSLHEEGRAAGRVLAESRARIAAVVGAAADELLFTASGSEADALAVIGAARAAAHRGKHVIVSSIEHKAVLKSAALLAQDGFDISYVAPDRRGRITPQALVPLLRPDTVLVSVMYANNEIGTVEPVRELAQAVRQHSGGAAIFHSDACQAPGQLPLTVEELGVDLLSLNGSKAYGPKGIGALYVRRGVALCPLVPGEQERGLRGGTESATLAAGLAAALEEAEERRSREAPRLSRLRDLLLSEIARRVPEVVVNGDRRARLPNNAHVSVPGIEGESMLLMLDAAGIACATGSACNSFDLAPSHVLLAVGGEASLAHGSIRFTLGRSTTRTQVLHAAAEFSRIVTLLGAISALTLPQYAHR